MASTRRRITLLIAVPAALLAGLAFAPMAGAVVYCVPNDTIDPSCDAGQGQTTIQAALTAAAGTNTVADTVRIDAGNYSEPALAYSSTMAANVVTVIGDGTTQTLLTIPNTMGMTTGLFVSAPAGSVVRDLAMTIPMDADMNGDIGILLGTAAMGQNLLVDGPAAFNGTGVSLAGTSMLDDSTVNLPFAGGTNSGVRQNGGSPTITDSTLHADVGVNHSGTGFTTTIDRSTIQASSRGATLDSGTVNVRNSVIDLGATSGVGLQAANLNPGTAAKTLNADHVTVVGGIAGSIGFRVLATAATAAQTSTGTLTNSVISGPTTPIFRQASNDGTPMMDSVANVTTDYSNYNAAANFSSNGANGMGMITEVNPSTNLAPGFVNPAAGNYHLAPSSALIDIGDPTAPMGLDLDGDPRGLDGTPPCVPMAAGNRDIGADEYNCVPPETVITAGTSGLSNNPQPSFSFSSEAGATFECRFDSQAFGACSGPGATHIPGAPLSDGPHQFEVRAIDMNANLDPTPAHGASRSTQPPPTQRPPARGSSRRERSGSG